MSRAFIFVALALPLVGCPGGGGRTDGGTTLPPQVFLVINDTNVIGTSVKGTVNVTGCKKVKQIQVLNAGANLINYDTPNVPMAFELTGGAFAGKYNQLGLAAELRLSAKVVCDDDRSNTSTTVGASFMPVESRLSTGNQLIPDAFTASGGLSGTPVTFVGCIGTQTGTAIAVFDTSGSATAVKQQDEIPFNCSANLQITDRNRATGTRWFWEPGIGAIAMNSDLKVLKSLKGDVQQLGVSDNGTAIVWVKGLPKSTIYKLEPSEDTSNDWSTNVFAGIMNSSPVVDIANRAVWVTSWQYLEPTGNIVAFKYSLDTGALLNQVQGSSGPPIIISQQYSAFNEALMPRGVLSADGSIVYLSLLSQDNSGTVHTTVLSCTTAGSCDTLGRRWASRTFDGVLGLLLPFSSGNYLAAIGGYNTWFLNAQTGAVANLSEAAIHPSGSLEFFGAQFGINSEVYLLTRPTPSKFVNTYTMEVIAIDRPETGELYRFSYGGGESPLGGLTVGVDDLGQAWFRVGPDLVKPLSLSQYREARGATTPLP